MITTHALWLTSPREQSAGFGCPEYETVQSGIPIECEPGYALPINPVAS